MSQTSLERAGQVMDALSRRLSDLDDAWDIVRADIDDGVGAGDVAVLVGGQALEAAGVRE